MGGISFSSVGYLGMRHASDALPPWRALTTGVPSVVAEPPTALQLRLQLAALTGYPCVELAPSTLHAFRDLYALLASPRSIVLLDAGVYPLQAWMARATRPPLRVLRFRHHSADALAAAARQVRRRGLRPVVGADAFCVDCGRTAPLESYQRVASEHGGWLIVDDTQVLGLFGKRRSAAVPWGYAGGGSLRYHGLVAERLVGVASLAKGLGVPIALVGGDHDLMRELRAADNTRVHSSPPSAAALAAAWHAVRLNRRNGDARRARLFRLIRLFRQSLNDLLPETCGPPFPVQQIILPTTLADRAARQLAREGLGVLRTEGSEATTQRLNVVLSARHRRRHVARLAEALRRAVGTSHPLPQTCYHRITGRNE